MQNQIIDVHAHCITPQYRSAMVSAGIHDVEGFPLPNWSEDEHLAAMERNGIRASVLSVSTPGITFLHGQQGIDMARRCNEDLAERRQRTSGRLGAFALLPLPDITASLQEVEYALDTLGLDGIGVLSNYDGQYLGDEAFRDLFVELDRRGSVLFVHPTAPPHWQQLAVGYPATALEYPFDVTRWLLQVVSAGLLRTCRALRIIATHGGGTMPFLASRVCTLTAMQSRLEPKMREEEFLSTLQKIYYDCTAATGRITWDGYKALVPADRKLFGSDHPFMPASSVPPALRTLDNPGRLSPNEREQLQWSNAATLFPGLVKLWV